MMHDRDPLLNAIVLAPSSANYYQLQFSGGVCCSDLQLNTDFPNVLNSVITIDQWSQCMQSIVDCLGASDIERFFRIIGPFFPFVGFVLVVSTFAIRFDYSHVLLFTGIGVMVVGAITSSFINDYFNRNRKQRIRNALTQCTQYAPNLSWNTEPIGFTTRRWRNALFITITWNTTPITIVQQPIIAYNTNPNNNNNNYNNNNYNYNSMNNNNQPPPGYNPSAPPSVDKPNNNNNNNNNAITTY